MRYYIILFILIITTSCVNNYDDSETYKRLNLSRKELTKLFKGQELFSIRGIKSKFEGLAVRVKTIPSNKNHVLLLEFGRNYYKGSNEIILHSEIRYFEIYNSLKWFIDTNKLYWPSMEKVQINFNEGVTKDFVKIDVPNKENIEYSESRFLQKLSLSTNPLKLEIDESEIPNLIDVAFYQYDYNSLVLLSVFLNEAKIKLNSSRGIKIIPNPITNQLQFAIDFSYISKKSKGIDFDTYTNSLNNIKPINKELLKIAFEDYLQKKELQLYNKVKTNKYKNKTLAGTVNLNSDLRLNKVNLTVFPGSVINLFGNSKLIIDFGKISFNGTKENPIQILAHDKNSIFLTNIDSARFNHVKFYGLINWSDSCKNVPSAITIYNSTASFVFCEFKDNKGGDDMINLFQSNFSFENCSFENIFSDALDSDFSSGSISNTSFLRIGNDGIDCSGSRLIISKSSFNIIEDKAISAGENSNIIINQSEIDSSEIAFVSKDGAILKIDNTCLLRGNKLDFAVFIKKPFYNTPSLNYNGYISHYNYLLQTNSNIKSQDSLLFYINDVESKMYGNEYGKSSK